MTISLQLLGDISLDGLYCSPQNHQAFRDNCKSINEILGECDYRIANWEAPLMGNGEILSSKEIRLATTWEAAESFLPLKVNIVTLANNHIYDCCTSGYLRTCEFMDKHAIWRVGSGMTSEEAEKPLLFEKNGISFALLNYVSPEACPPLPKSCDVHLNFLDEVRVLNDIRTWKSKVDHVVVGLHWGHRDYLEYPPPSMRTFGRSMIENGARLVYGGQYHILLGYETWKKGCIIYSLGNYCFSPVGMSRGDVSWISHPLTMQVGVACLTFDKYGISSIEWKYLKQNEKSLLLQEDTSPKRRHRHMSLSGGLRKNDRVYRTLYRTNVWKWDIIDYVALRGGLWNTVLSIRWKHIKRIFTGYYRRASN